MSEAELHSLRLRLDAGRLSKARRGELIQPWPTGLVRDHKGDVQFDPDIAVQERIGLVFGKFFELGSAHKVLRYLVKHRLKLPRRQASGLYAGQLLWKDPSSDALLAMLGNPAYAGAFAYGRRIADPTRQVSGRPATGRIRQPKANWLALVKDVYAAYITWQEYERIQQMLANNQQRMAEQLARSQAIRNGVTLLTGLTRCGKCGRAMSVSYKEQRFQYICKAALDRYAKPTCQYLSGRAIDETVVQAFFDVLQSAEIDALERVNAKQIEHQQELLGHLQKEVMRLEYEAGRAERQYNCVDPENRLIAATLEKKWDNALSELEAAKSRLNEAQSNETPPIAIPTELRKAFLDVGRNMAKVWQELPNDTRKRLLGTLVIGVNLHRHDDGTLQFRIVWRGGQVTEKVIRVRSLTLRGSEAEKNLVVRVPQLAGEGLNDKDMSDRLNKEGFVPCRADGFTATVVTKVRRRYQIDSAFQQARESSLPGVYKVQEMAELLQVDPSWIYRSISRGIIKIAKDKRFGCYLFPRNRIE